MLDKQKMYVKMKEVLQHRITSASDDMLFYNIVLPVLKTWDGKKLTKRLETKLKNTLPSDYIPWIRKDYSFLKLYISKGSKTINFYLHSMYSPNMIFSIDYFTEQNSSIYKEYERISIYKEAIKKLDEWIESYEKIVNDVKELSSNMEKYNCQYLIDWSDIRYV